MMNDFKISIEETKTLMDKNIFVFINGLGRKLYCETVLSEDKRRIELVPLSREKLKLLGVEVEESYSSQVDVFDVSVEETESESEAENKPKTKFDINNPSDMAKAAKIATLKKYNNLCSFCKTQKVYA